MLYISMWRVKANLYCMFNRVIKILLYGNWTELKSISVVRYYF